MKFSTLTAKLKRQVSRLIDISGSSRLAQFKSHLSRRRHVVVLDSKSRSPFDRLHKINWHKQSEFASHSSRRQQADYSFYIDIVGTCNLRCPSCPVGNSDQGYLGKGLMTLPLFENILKKIAAEHAGEAVQIGLYNWGESPLHPELSKFIAATRKAGFGCGTSSNFNNVGDLRTIIKADPSYIRISLSGFSNKVYQRTHKGGDIFEVKSNMRGGPGCLNRISASISGASAGVRLPSGEAAA